MKLYPKVSGGSQQIGYWGLRSSLGFWDLFWNTALIAIKLGAVFCNNFLP